MKSFVLLYLILAYFPLNFAGVGQGLLKDPNYPGKCVIDCYILSAGEEITLPGKCQKVICHEDSHASFQSCGALADPPGYVLADYLHPNAEYPKCCERKLVPKTECKNEER